MKHLLLLALPVLAFLVELVCIHLGRRYRRLPHDAASNAAVAPVISTVLSLMGLVLAFSFSNAAGRLESNRRAILDEANAIETVWNRIDLAQPEFRPTMTDLFRRYVDARIRAYRTLEEQIGRREYDREVQDSANLFQQLWVVSVAGTADNPTNRVLLLDSFGKVRDTATARTLAMNTHLPPAIYAFLFGIAMIGAALIGSVMATSRSPLWFYRIVVAAVLSWTLFAILDMEYPRLGAFQLLRHADALLAELRKSMG
jgi:Protein of unknown function (DUF4239)